ERPGQAIDDPVRRLAAAVEALIDDDRLLVNLGEEVAVEVRVAADGRVRQIDIRGLALGQFGDLLPVRLDPTAIAQRQLVGDRHNGDLARVAAVRLQAEAQHGRLARSPLEVTIDAAVRLHGGAVDLQQIGPYRDVDPRDGERSAEI